MLLFFISMTALLRAVENPNWATTARNEDLSGSDATSERRRRVMIKRLRPLNTGRTVSFCSIDSRSSDVDLPRPMVLVQTRNCTALWKRA
jgi:hypothetical protein